MFKLILAALVQNSRFPGIALGVYPHRYVSAWPEQPALPMSGAWKALLMEQSVPSFPVSRHAEA